MLYVIWLQSRPCFPRFSVTPPLSTIPPITAFCTESLPSYDSGQRRQAGCYWNQHCTATGSPPCPQLLLASNPPWSIRIFRCGGKYLGRNHPPSLAPILLTSPVSRLQTCMKMPTPNPRNIRQRAKNTFMYVPATLLNCRNSNNLLPPPFLFMFDEQAEGKKDGRGEGRGGGGGKEMP